MDMINSKSHLSHLLYIKTKCRGFWVVKNIKLGVNLGFTSLSVVKCKHGKKIKSPEKENWYYIDYIVVIFKIYLVTIAEVEF